MSAPARIQPTRYEVNCLPEDDINGHSFALAVEYRGRDRWAVVRHGQCLGADGTWSYESVPSERTDEWLDHHRFDLGTALRLALAAAPSVTVNGWTVADALAMHAATTDEERDAVWATIRARHRAAHAGGEA
ncbi:hypothetical protein [Streptomyces sp. MP131-18]|uniref:hypothetical protein n=1 Tax=Streptomyces sp. MP131-18 TaxID=1857892 RepID=UPI00097C7BFF|nr:hypothetical protein [Streptomyces sp. MP131-18]ONK09484.1 hypothetical protein STBA_01840 [Streptomyces sp. MP131-18]